jgi:U3 small nucleolar RNA-associated protein 24
MCDPQAASAGERSKRANLGLDLCPLFASMGRKRRLESGFTRVLNPKDERIIQKEKSKEKLAPLVQRPRDEERLGAVPPELFFQYNTALGPPFRVLIDTNFINFSIQNRIDLQKGLMDCLFAPAKACVTDCVVAELEKLGRKYRVALRIVRDASLVQRLKCTHKGTYADDCIVERVMAHRVFIVATCDRDLRRRLRKIPGVPIMYIAQHKYTVERMPDAFMAPRV